jgi:preprotein translocase subunit SecG
MATLFLILIVLTSGLLSIIVLIQNPKGGGLAGNIAGFSNQFMGVKQTTDVLEKGTWFFAGIIVFLCLVSALMINKPGEDNNIIKQINTGSTTAPSQQTTPAQTAPATQPADTGK